MCEERKIHMRAKTEKEKMLSGELYHGSDPELVKERLNARRLTRLFNQSLETDDEKRTELLRKLFGSSGKNLILSHRSTVIMAIIFISVRTSMRILIACFSTCAKSV